MDFIWNVTKPANWIISLCLIVIIYVLLTFVFIRVFKRKSVFIILGSSFVIIFFSFLFNLEIVTIIGCFLSCVAFSVCFLSNLGDLRNFFSNPFRRQSAKNANFGIEKIYDRKALYKNIQTAVINLSKTRTGAIITFERNTSLKEIMKNGVYVHAPVTPELLVTIFYPGTRLHDGAVIIHGNEIVAASVFFTPTTQPFAGKYGSRHRAAIGISEISDAITVVVSEETGRISLAVNGQLETVDPDHFLNAFETYMSEDLTSED